MALFKIDPNDIPQANGIRKVRIAGKQICLIRHDDALHATSVKCPHAGADLSAGWCENQQLVCPYHRHAFDLKTGRGFSGQGNYVSVYPIEEREDGFYVAIRPSFWKRLFS